MWIMYGFQADKEDQYSIFNKTLFVASTFFLIGSFLQFITVNTYIGCKIKEGILNSGIN